MTHYVLDSSVAAKWYLPAAYEPLSDEAFRLLQDHQELRIDFVVPDLFFAEMGSIFWKAVRKGRCDQVTADTAIREIIREGFRAVSSADLLPSAYQLASAYNRSVYDCMYLALAIQTNTHVITADEKLANAIGGRLPVTWLGLF